MANIDIDGVRYKVLDNLGYQGGHYAKEVATPDGPRKAVQQMRGGKWRFWGAEDRLGSDRSTT